MHFLIRLLLNLLQLLHLLFLLLLEFINLLIILLLLLLLYFNIQISLVLLLLLHINLHLLLIPQLFPTLNKVTFACSPHKLFSLHGRLMIYLTIALYNVVLEIYQIKLLPNI